MRTKCDFPPGADGPVARDIDDLIAPGAVLPAGEPSLETIADTGPDF